MRLSTVVHAGMERGTCITLRARQLGVRTARVWHCNTPISLLRINLDNLSILANNFSNFGAVFVQTYLRSSWQGMQTSKKLKIFEQTMLKLPNSVS